jgi:ketosteroid isomerase-like protein
MPEADPATVEAIQELEDGLQDALMAVDVDWFREHWAADAVYVHLSGGVDDRDEFIERLSSRTTIYDARETGDLRIRQYGDTAIATGWSRIDILVKGVEKLLDTRFTRVYARVDGRWQLVSNQSGANTALATTHPRPEAAATST